MYTIGQVSEMFGLPISTLRYYDKQGLFPEMERVSGIRKFSDTELEALRVIECLKKSGLEIKDIKQFMDWCVKGASTYSQRKALFEKQRETLEAEIAAKMHDADVLVFATPVYYYSVSGQFKTMLDRANPLFGTDYAFTKAYLLATAAENEAATVEGTVKAVQGWVDCFDRCELAETIFAGGVSSVGDIAGHPALEQAYQSGKEV